MTAVIHAIAVIPAIAAMPVIIKMQERIAVPAIIAMTDGGMAVITEHKNPRIFSRSIRGFDISVTLLLSKDCCTAHRLPHQDRRRFPNEDTVINQERQWWSF